MQSLMVRSLIVQFSPPSRLSILFINSRNGTARRRPEISSQASPFSSSSSSSPHSRRHHDEDLRDVKVSVWWDFGDCVIPAGVNVFRVASNITLALRSSGVKGPVTINAFGDVSELSRSTQDALTSTGISLTHVPHCGKTSADKTFMANLVYWVSQNPPPIHFFLISGNKNFTNTLHRLRMSNYNILLSTTDSAPSVLCSAATIMWPWSNLVKGENHIVRHFNHPPDGVYGSWYGHFKGVLDDPFADADQIVSSQQQESMELISETKSRPVPKVVVNAIRQVLSSHPEGIGMSSLRIELRRSNVSLDKDFYGYKKFSNFLSSMPSIIKLVPALSPEYQPLVIGIQKSNVEPTQSSSKTVGKTEIHDEQKVTTPDNQKLKTATPLDASATMNPSTSKVVDANVDITTPILTQENSTIKNIESSSSGANMDVPVSTSTHPSNDAIDVGIFRRLSRKWFQIGKNCSDLEVDTASNMPISVQKLGVEKKNHDHAEETKFKEEKVSLSTNNSFNMRSNKAHQENISTKMSEKQKDVPNTKPSLFNQVTSWCNVLMYGKKDQENYSEVPNVNRPKQKNEQHGECLEDLTNFSSQLESHKLFSKPFFWESLRSILISKGYQVVIQSRTREELARGLQKEASLLLKDFTDAQLLQLINLLIAEKKWLEVSPSHDQPFRVLISDERKHVQTPPYASKGLSSLFMSRPPTAKEKDDKKSGVPSNLSNGTSVNKAPQNLTDLKSWFEKKFDGVDSVESEEIQKAFQDIFGVKLVPSNFGSLSMGNLISSCLTGKYYNQGKRKVSPSREEILTDCRKLVIKLFEENPEGFNMSIFRPNFMQKFGYILDYQMLGYSNLSSLLQIMPGVRIESSYVLPAKFLQSNFEKSSMPEILSENIRSDDGKVSSKAKEGGSNNEDCSWEELGPLSSTDICEDTETVKQNDKEMDFDKASLSDEYLTDSEGDSPPHTELSEGSSGRSQVDSSLLQVLDSWYNSTEGNDKGQAEVVDGLVDCSKIKAVNSPTDIKIVNHEKVKLRPPKRYSFVSDSKDNDKEKLVDSILGSLKKAGDSKLHN